ncbi:NADPH-dependent FMN reductase [Undibacterium sp. RuRC25W]|uniref:NADPH-dependent FMN reductase n=1 Tax=Undibacterium sp. RuRC25W TaxID=3413047 RepID=UPI003BF40D37
MSILLLSGSPSSPSRSSRLLSHIGQRLNAHGQRTVSIHVRDLPAQALLHADFGDPELQAAQQILKQADAIVIATPIYKAAYSGLLKTFLDVLPQEGLAGKIVLPLAVGGGQSHMLALDYGLRPILQALGAHHVLQSIYATEPQIVWNDISGLQIASEIEKRVEQGVNALLDSLQCHYAQTGKRSAEEGKEVDAPTAVTA